MSEWDDVQAFMRWTYTEVLRQRVSWIRAIDPDHEVVSHYGSGRPMQAFLDPWELAECLDAYGISSYQDDFDEIEFAFACVRAASPGRQWWLGETNGGRMWYGIGQVHHGPARVQSMALKAMAMGAQGAVYWQYRPESFGAESPNFGVVDLAGRDTNNSLETSPSGWVITLPPEATLVVCPQ